MLWKLCSEPGHGLRLVQPEACTKPTLALEQVNQVSHVLRDTIHSAGAKGITHTPFQQVQHKETPPVFICLFSGLPSPAGRGDSDYSVSPTRTCSNCGRNDCILPKPLKEKKEHVPVTLSCSINTYSNVQTITPKYL